MAARRLVLRSRFDAIGVLEDRQVTTGRLCVDDD